MMKIEVKYVGNLLLIESVQAKDVVDTTNVTASYSSFRLATASPATCAWDGARQNQRFIIDNRCPPLQLSNDCDQSQSGFSLPIP